MFAHAGVPVAFLVPTPTGYGKSIMDAIGTVRILLKDEGIHNYYEQKQGTSNKVMVKSYFVGTNSLIESAAMFCFKNILHVFLQNIQLVK